MSSLTTASREELTQVLRILRDYRGAYKQIGKRAVLHDPRVQRAKTLRAQYAHEDNAPELQHIIATMIRTYFPEADAQTVVYETNPQLVGGARIFY